MQVLQGNRSQARPGVLGRGHRLRHLRGGGQTAQRRVEDSVAGRRGERRPTQLDTPVLHTPRPHDAGTVREDQ